MAPINVASRPRAGRYNTKTAAEQIEKRLKEFPDDYLERFVIDGKVFLRCTLDKTLFSSSAISYKEGIGSHCRGLACRRLRTERLQLHAQQGSFHG